MDRDAGAGWPQSLPLGGIEKLRLGSSCIGHSYGRQASRTVPEDRSGNRCGDSQARTTPPVYVGRHIRCNSFTLLEVLVVVALVGILAAVLLPALLAGREAARRVACTNHLKQLGLAVLNFENARGQLPTGVSGNMTYGSSWWVRVLPFLEQSTLYDSLDRRRPHHGTVLLNLQNAKAVNGQTVEVMLCPSSPIPPLHRVGSVEVMMPSYVGIAGAARDKTFAESRINKCCAPMNDGQISGGGLLIPNRPIRLREVKDGLSKTMLIGEISDYAVDRDGREQRIDGGFPEGWITGTKLPGTPPDYLGSLATPAWNITTIRYRVNTRDFELPGVDDNHGPNNPLASAHPSGANMLLADGSVHFLVDPLELTTLKRLATRDDGQVIEDTQFAH